MSKLARTALICLIAGAVVAGVGGGIAFAEFNKLQYGGSVDIYERATKTLTQHVSLAPGQKVVFDQEGDWAVLYEYTPDATLPAGTIAMDVEYAPELVTKLDSFVLPVDQSRIADAAAEYMPDVAYVVGIDESKSRSRHSDLADFFKAKDIILRDLRNGVLRDYDNNWMTYVHVRYSPDLEGCIVSDSRFWDGYGKWQRTSSSDDLGEVSDPQELDAPSAAEELDAPGEPSELEPSQLGELKQG